MRGDRWRILPAAAPCGARVVRQGTAALFGVCLTALCSSTALAAHDDTQDAFVFAEVAGVHRTGVDSQTDLEHDELVPKLDLFYSREDGDWRLLGEAFLSKDEREVERLQFGRLVGARTTLWLGHYHNPLGFWNTQYHHGTFLQAAASRPGIHEYEDDGGPLPMHLAGLLLEGEAARQRGALRYALALGAGPELHKELEPVDIFSPGSGSHRVSATARLGYALDDTGGEELGLFVAYSRIPDTFASLGEVHQSTAGLYASVSWQATRLIAEAFFVRNRSGETGAHRDESFANGYL